MPKLGEVRVCAHENRLAGQSLRRWLVEQLPLAMFQSDASSRVSFPDSAWRALHGYSSGADLTKLNPLETFADPDAGQGLIDTFIRKRRGVS